MTYFWCGTEDVDARDKPAMTSGNAATRFPFCAEPERLPPSRPRLFGAAEFRPGAQDRRAISAAHRGYRRHAVPAGIRGGDLRRPRLARHRLGNAGAAAIGTLAELSRRGRETVGAGTDLSGLRKPRRNRAAGRTARDRRSHGRAIPMARRSIRARQSRYLPKSGAADRIGRALRAAARHGGGHAPGRRTLVGRAGRRARRRNRRRRRPSRKPGAMSSWRARRRRPAIICRS